MSLLHTERMGRVDGCPTACGNVQPPRDVYPTATGFAATYECGTCGQSWTTFWRDS